MANPPKFTHLPSDVKKALFEFTVKVETNIITPWDPDTPYNPTEHDEWLADHFKSKLPEMDF